MLLNVEQIKTAIELLPVKDYGMLREWFSEKDWKIWDQEIKRDSESGKLDFLIQEAMYQKIKGNLKEL